MKPKPHFVCCLPATVVTRLNNFANLCLKSSNFIESDQCLCNGLLLMRVIMCSCCGRSIVDMIQMREVSKADRKKSLLRIYQLKSRICPERAIASVSIFLLFFSPPSPLLHRSSLMASTGTLATELWVLAG